MTSVTSYGARLPLKGILIGLFWTVVVINSIFWITVGIMADKRGQYGGLHYGDAKNDALKAMGVRYGAKLANNLRFGEPDVHNTHLRDSVTFGSGQVRVFHFIGPNGARYCVPVNDSTATRREANAITKGCSW